MRARGVSIYAVAAGAVAALLAIGWGLTLGGGLALGRLDPLFSLSGRVVVAAGLALLMRARPRDEALAAVLTMLALSLALDAVLGTVLATRFAWPQAIFALGVQAAAWATTRALTIRLAQRSSGLVLTALAAGAALLAIGAAWLTPALYAPSPTDTAPRLAIVSGVPIEWIGPADMTAILDNSAQRSPLLPAFAERFSVVRPDVVDAARLKDVDVLLLAHPRALQPVELVAIDRWVRDGGHALILADALVSWPPDYPLGDRRNPPITSLLTPMLGHWGLVLGPPANDGDDVFMADGYRIHAMSTGRFSATGRDCAIGLGGRTADCRLGHGRAVLIADVDLLNPDLWSGGGDSAARWRAGNLDWIIGLIDELAGARRAALATPSWQTVRPDRGESASQARKSQEQGGNSDDL